MQRGQSQPGGRVLGRSLGRRAELQYGIGDVPGLQVELAQVKMDIGGAGIACSEVFQHGDGFGLIIHGQEGAGEALLDLEVGGLQALNFLIDLNGGLKLFIADEQVPEGIERFHVAGEFLGDFAQAGDGVLAGGTPGGRIGCGLHFGQLNPDQLLAKGGGWTCLGEPGFQDVNDLGGIVRFLARGGAGELEPANWVVRELAGHLAE